MVFDAQGLRVISLPPTRVAIDPAVGKEVHLHSQLTIAFTIITAASGGIEAEPSRCVAPDLRFRQLGEKIAYQIEETGVGGRIRGRLIPQRSLIDANDFIDVLNSPDIVVRGRRRLRTMQSAGQCIEKNVIDQ